MDEDEIERLELPRQLFALLTARLEDSVALALEGQGRQELARQAERAQRLEAELRDSHLIARALVALSADRG